MQELLLFTANNALVAALALRLGSRLLADQRFWRRFSGTLLLVPAITGLVLQILDLIGPVSAIRSLALLLLTAIVEFAIPRKAIESEHDGNAEPRRPATRLELASYSGLIGLWGVAVQTTLWRGTHFRWDDLTYHAAIPAFWLQRGALDPAPFTYQSYFPLNSELFSLWFMLPLESDAQVGFALLLWISLAITALLAIGRNLGQDVCLSVIMASFMFASPNFVAQIRSFNGVDLAVASLTLAALAFAHCNTRERRSEAINAGFCGVAAGLAAGAKPPFLALCALLALWWLYRGRSRSSRPSLRPLATFLATCAVCGGYWYARNLLLAGNPLFPAEIGPFDGPLDRAVQRSTSMVGALSNSGWDLASLLTIAKTRMRLPMPLGVLFVAGLLLAPLAIAKSRRQHIDGSWRYLALVAGSGLLLLVAHPFQPFSGTVNRPNSGMQHNVRFILASVAVGWAVFPSLIPNSRRWRIAARVLCASALFYTLAGHARGHLFLAAVGAGLGYLALLAWQRPPSPRLVRALPALVVATLLIGAVARGPSKSAETDEDLFRETGYGTLFERGWRALDALPAGTRVAHLSNVTLTSSYYYPQFGRALHLVPVAIGHDGRQRPPLHEGWRDEPEDWWWEFRRDRRADPKLIENLRAAQVDFILVDRWSFGIRWNKQPDWPAVREVLLRSPAAKRSYADEFSELYDLR